MNCIKIFEDLMMYSQAKDEKIIDKNIRLSTFRTIEEDSLFDSFDILIDEINKRDKFQKYKLMENYITRIKYEKVDILRNMVIIKVSNQSSLLNIP